MNQKNEKREIKDDNSMLSNAMRAMLLEPFNIAEEIGHEDIDSRTEYCNQSFARHDSPSPQKEINNKEFQEINLPDSTLPTICHLQQQSLLEDLDQNFYSSDPELNQANDNQLSPLPFGQSAPFLSLTNLSVVINKPNETCTNNNDRIPKKLNNLNTTCVVPDAIIIHPSTPLTKSPDTFSFHDLNSSSPSPLVSRSCNKVDVVIKTIYLIDHINNNSLITNDAKINQKSSSYTNLSCTNKVPMLAPSPHLKRQLRSSTELVPSGSTSPAVPSTVAASTQSSMSAMTLTVGNLRALSAATSDQHMSTVAHQGHNRTESVGNKVPSPAKVANISASTAAVASIQSNNKNGEIFRRSSDSDLSVTPKGESYFCFNIFIIFKYYIFIEKLLPQTHLVFEKYFNFYTYVLFKNWCANIITLQEFKLNIKPLKNQNFIDHFSHS